MNANQSTTEYNLEKGDYLPKTIILDIIKNKQNTVLISPTNSGKTESCIKGALEAGIKFIFVADTILLADQLGVKYNLPVYYSGKDKPEGNFITIYYHLSSFEDSNTIVFIDEFHSIIADYGYKTDTLNSLQKCFNSFKQIIGLTGTPFAETEGFIKVKIHRPRSKRIIKCIKYEDSYIDSLISNILLNKDKTHFISLFNLKLKLQDLIKKLIKAGLEEDDIALLNAETKKTKVYKDLVSSNKINGYKVIISTFVQGYNIEDKNEYYLHILPTNKALHTSIDIEQLINRFRNNVPETFIYWNHKETYSSSFTFQNCYKKELQEGKDAGNKIKALLNLDKINTPEYLQIFKPYFKSEKILNFNLELLPNQTGIHHSVLITERDEMYKDFNLMNKVLKMYSYEVQTHTINHHLFQSKMSNKQSNKVEKSEIEEAFKQKLIEAHTNTNTLIFEHNSVSEQYNYLTTYFTKQESYNLTLKYGQVSRKWNYFKNKVNIANSNDTFIIGIRTKFQQSFVLNTQYTSAEIVNKVNSINKSKSISSTSITKATQTLKLYFNVSKVKITTGIGRREYRYVINKLILN